MELSFIASYPYVWPAEARANAESGIHWMMVNAARVALNSTRTAANRVKFLEEVASWPSGHNGEPKDYMDYFADGALTPSKDWSWVNPETDPPSRTTADMWAAGFNQATNVEDAPTSGKLIGREWIKDIP